MAERNKKQLAANELDSDMFRLAENLDAFAALVDDAGLAALARHIRINRLGVRINMHREDREATK